MILHVYDKNGKLARHIPNKRNKCYLCSITQIIKRGV